jgi:DNA-binding transcriptional regulator YiaG
MSDKIRLFDETPSANATEWARIDAMTDAEADAAAAADPDGRPLSRPARKIAAVKRLRFSLNLGPERFADRYRIPLAVLRSWERHEAEPDAIACAYLAAIAADPDGVAAAVARAQALAAAE